MGILLVCVVGYLLMNSGGAGLGDLGSLAPAEPEGAGFEPSGEATVAPTRAPVAIPTGPVEGPTWLVMLYQDADDRTLEQDICIDLNEAERVGSTANVRIVAQTDRYSGGYSGDGNWTSAKRFFVTRDDDLTRVSSQVVADLGEQNMADGATLVDFVTWAAQTYPSDKLVLILSDHGMGWPGGWSDPAPATAGDRSTPLSAAVGNELYLNELDAALETARERAGIGKFEVICLDACLMGQVEVLTALAPHARYAVVSEETEPSLGWAYASFLGDLAANPAMSGEELSKRIVDSYISEDQRIVDDEARAELVGRGMPTGSLFGFAAPTSAEVASQMGRDTTLSAVDLSVVPALVTSLNQLCMALQGANQKAVAQARSYAQPFTSVWGQEVPPSYIDLGNLVQLLKQTKAGGSVNAAADGVLAALQSAVVAEKHGAGLPGATGVAIYFPNSMLFKTPETGPSSYTRIASRFAASSLWDDYLAFHYTGRAFSASAREPVELESAAAVTAPGKGKIQMTPIKLSGKVASPGHPVLLSTDISAQNLGHVLLFAGYYDTNSRSLYVADMDYLESAETREVDGVYYPVWPAGEFTLEFEWEPIVYYISNGEESVAAQLTPRSYGAKAEDAEYTVDGIYTFTSGEARYARLVFRDGALRQVLTFTGEGAAGAPREVQPQTGDSFTVLERWLDMDAQGRVVEQAAQEGGTLEFRDQMFTWLELDAAAGDYVVGFIAQDLDGSSQQVSAQVRVE